MPVTEKISGDARLADKIIELYVQSVEGLTTPECRGTSFSEKQCDVLIKTLGKGVEGKVTSEEKKELKESGFSDEFLNTLAGANGLKALKQRIPWLADHVTKKWWRLDYSKYDRKKLAEEFIGIMDWERKASTVYSFLEESSDLFLNGVDFQKIFVKAIDMKEIVDPHYLLALVWRIKNTQGNTSEEDISSINALGYIGEECAVPTLIEKLQKHTDANYYFSQKVITALGRVGDERAVPALIAHFLINGGFHDDIYSDALANMGDEAVPELLEKLKDENVSLRHLAAITLGKIAHPAAVHDLRRMADNDPNQACRDVAKKALEKIQEKQR